MGLQGFLYYNNSYIQDVKMETNSSSSSTHKSGINIKDALSILSDRAKGGGDKISSGSNSIPDELKVMGQQIDISKQMNFANLKCACSIQSKKEDSEASVKKVDDDRHKAMNEARMKNTAKIRNKIDSMTMNQALGMIFQAQQERVATYNMYEK